MLTEKMTFMTTALNKQIKEQAESANEIEVKAKKQSQELLRQQQDLRIKEQDLKKLDDSNGNIKKLKYDQEIEKLQRKL